MDRKERALEKIADELKRIRVAIEESNKSKKYYSRFRFRQYRNKEINSYDK